MEIAAMCAGSVITLAVLVALALVVCH